MKKFLIIIVISALPFITNAQNTDVKATDNATKTELAIKKVEPISVNPKTQHLDLNYKKSIEIISIKAYIKSQQLKRKATLVS